MEYTARLQRRGCLRRGSAGDGGLFWKGEGEDLWGCMEFSPLVVTVPGCKQPIGQLEPITDPWRCPHPWACLYSARGSPWLFSFFFFKIFLLYHFFNFMFLNLHPNYLAYGATMISGVDSLVPLTHVAHPPSHTATSNPLFVLHIKVSSVLSASLFLYYFCFPSLMFICFVS